MENKITRVVYILDTPEGVTELKVVADRIKQTGDWVLAIWENNVVCGVKMAHLKAFYLEYNLENTPIKQEF